MFNFGCMYRGSLEIKCLVSGAFKLMLYCANNVQLTLNPKTQNLTKVLTKENVTEKCICQATMPV